MNAFATPDDTSQEGSTAVLSRAAFSES